MNKQLSLAVALVLILFSSAPAAAALAVVQSVGLTTNGSVSNATTSNITTTTTNLIVCDLAYYGTYSPFADSKSNTYATAVAEITSGSDALAHLRQVYKENAAGGASHNFTFNFTTTGYPGFSCTEISGAATSGALDKTSSNVQAAGVGETRTSGLTANTTQTNEILKSACTTEATRAFTSQGGFTDHFNASSDGDTMGIVSAREIVSSSGQKEYTAQIAVDDAPSLCQIGTYKEATAGATGGGQFRRRGQ